jgi:hypothetical protein
MMAVSKDAARSMFEAMKAVGPTRSDSVRRMEAVAYILDLAFVFPGTNQRIGLDAIIGLVPGFGDIVTTLLSSYVIWEARQLGLSRFAIGRMLGNLAIHATVGSIPVIGDVFDAFFRVNQRNMRIVRSYLKRHAEHGAVEGQAVRVAPTATVSA